MWQDWAYTFIAMLLPGSTVLRRFLPTACLLAGTALLASLWPDARLLLPDDALRNPQLLEVLQLLLVVPVYTGLLASLVLRRMMFWPWSWLGAILLLSHRPQLGMVEHLLSLSCELCLLLILSVAECLLMAWRDSLAQWWIRWQVVTALLVLLAGWQLPILPDNPGWQHLLASLLAMVLFSGSLLPHLNLHRPALRFPGWQGFRLPPHSFSIRTQHGLLHRPQPEPAPRLRPMLSLEEGYLVRHPMDTNKEGRRRTG